MTADILVVGAGASGLMAAWHAAKNHPGHGQSQYAVAILESMPRPARKIMISGKGRCNFTNVKDWNGFSPHLRANSSAFRAAFHNLTPEALIEWFGKNGMEAVVERGDRAFPKSYKASDVVDTLVRACTSLGVKLVCGAKVSECTCTDDEDYRFSVECEDGSKWLCRKLILATGGLSYPTTGSTGDGYRWAEEMGHKIVPTFPSLTALVPHAYKRTDGHTRGHIDRTLPLGPLGEKLCGVQLKNVQLSLEIDGNVCDTVFGDLDFTDGGIEGPIGFALSRKAVKAIINGARAALVLDLKAQVPLAELTARVEQLRLEVKKDPRSRGVRDKELRRILLGKLMPWNLIPGFVQAFPDAGSDSRRIAAALKGWRFELDGYVGYERAVVTAGGVAMDGIVSKNMESRFTKSLYFCGELLDVDADTGGYNLHTAFATGALAGMNAAKSL